MIAKKLADLIEKRIYKSLHFEDIPKEKMDQLLTEITEVVHERIVLRSIESLADDKKKAFAVELGSVGNNETAANRVMELYIPDIEQIVESEVELYRQELFNLAI